MTSREDWIGRTGREWARRADALEALAGPAGAAGIDALAPDEGARLLDLGCGAGTSTAALAARVGTGGHVTAVDVSPDLMAKARARLGGLGNVTLIEDDAATHPFEPGTFDGLHSRFGSMFFEDPSAAFANLRRALGPGAPAVFVCWRGAGRNEWASVPLGFLAEHPGRVAGIPAPTPGPGPFAWADPAVFHAALGAAGFREIGETPFDFTAEIAEGDDPDPLVRAVAFMMRIGPLAARLRGATEDVKDDARAFLERRLAGHLSDGAVRLRASAWIVRARA